jgi:membrane associated rhomboid family serine protease
MGLHRDSDSVVVRRNQDPREIELHALVLSARGIESEIVPENDDFNLVVAESRAVEADQELTAYENENQPPARVESRPRRSGDIELVLVYWTLLLFFFAAARHSAFDVAWLDLGSADSVRIKTGEWWRTATALCLHVSGGHLLSNLLFGGLFLLLLAQALGGGLAALSILAAGAGGNLLNALLRPAPHDSIGASTALFGAIGILAVLNMASRQTATRPGLRTWLPLAGGVMLLAFLGFSGEQTDILGHVCGFAAGLCLGVLAAALARIRVPTFPFQFAAALLAALSLALAWAFAIGSGF